MKRSLFQSSFAYYLQIKLFLETYTYIYMHIIYTKAYRITVLYIKINKSSQPAGLTPF